MYKEIYTEEEEYARSSFALDEVGDIALPRGQAAEVVKSHPMEQIGGVQAELEHSNNSAVNQYRGRIKQMHTRNLVVHFDCSERSSGADIPHNTRAIV